MTALTTDITSPDRIPRERASFSLQSALEQLGITPDNPTLRRDKPQSLDPQLVEEAVEILQPQFSSVVFRVCYRITENFQDAEDAVQDTFLEVRKYLFDQDHRNLRSLIIVIARHRAINIIKKRRRFVQAKYIELVPCREFPYSSRNGMLRYDSPKHNNRAKRGLK